MALAPERALEVQRPIATVVIGGCQRHALTLIVLPALYACDLVADQLIRQWRP